MILNKRKQDRQDLLASILRDKGEISGYELGQLAGLHAGALYPALMRMEDAGIIISRWGIATEERGWHRPRLYRLPNQVPVD